MSAPSVLPNRLTVSPTPSTIHEKQPILESLLAEYEKAPDQASDEEAGTVKRTVSPTKRPDMSSPITLDGQHRDLFSPNSPQNNDIDGAQKPSNISYGSPLQLEPRRERPRRKSFPRPRIATETFKTPTPPSPVRQSLPTSLPIPENPITPVASRIRSAPKTRKAFEVFKADPLRVSRLSSSPSSHYSQSSDSEVWTTPPTSQKEKPTSRLTSASPVAFDMRNQQPRHVASPPSTVAVQNYSDPATRHVSFAMRNSPKAVDGEMHVGSWKASWAERSPFPAPPGQRAKRNFSFEPGLHEQETHWEHKYDEIAKRDGRQRVDEGRAQPRRTSRGRKSAEELRADNERLRREMEVLREDFRALKEAVFASLGVSER